MNNVTHLNLTKIDPIFEEFKTFVDKEAGVKTIAFKYFSANESDALEYLGLLPQQNKIGVEFFYSLSIFLIKFYFWLCYEKDFIYFIRWNIRTLRAISSSFIPGDSS